MIYSTGCEALRIEFDRRCSTERRHDPLTIMDNSGRPLSIRSGKLGSFWHCLPFRQTTVGMIHCY